MPEWSYENIFVCALKLSSRLYRLSSGFPRQPETIIEYVSDFLQRANGKPTPIFFHPRAYEAKAFYGTIEQLGSRVDIFYDRNRNKCWRRFIITKELCHVLYDTPGSQHLTSTPEQIGSLLTQILASLMAVDFEKDHAASSEQATILMAVEVLLPHSERANVQEMISKGANHRDIAEFYVLPEQMVSFYLDPQYAAFMEKVTKAFKASGDS